jgi:modulator of FtsH protease HflC
MKRNPITLITGGVLVLIFALMLLTFQVRQSEVAAVTTFGKYSRSITDAGFQLRLPWPIQNIYRFDNRIQEFERKFEQTTTKDALNLIISVFAGWQVANPRSYLESLNGDTLRAEQTLESIVRNAKNAVIGQYAFNDLITTNLAAWKFDEIEAKMLATIQAQLGDRYGIQVRFLGIKQLGLPESITGKVFDQMKAERQKAIRQFQAEGDRQANIIRAEADVRANAILDDAKSKAILINGEAEARSSEYYGVMQQDPALANFIFKRKALEQSLTNRTTLILDKQTPPFDMLLGLPSRSATNR